MIDKKKKNNIFYLKIKKMYFDLCLLRSVTFCFYVYIEYDIIQ